MLSPELPGDPLAGIALGIVNNNTFLGQIANQRLQSAIVARSPTMHWQGVAREMQEIGVEIMQAHTALVDSSRGLVNSAAETQSHFDIFTAHRLPVTTFGGSSLTGTQTEASMTSGIWMGGC